MSDPGLPRRYHILETLGEGGTGAVYRARDGVEGRELAVKVLRDEAAAGGPDLGGDEFRLLASHSHPHIVQVFEYGVTRSARPYFTMELCRGEDLGRYAARRSESGSRLADDEGFLRVLAQVLGALGYVHSRRQVHGDLKASNILVAPGEPGGSGEPVAKLIDFGLARRLRPPAATSERTRGGGTLEYAAPEALRGERADWRADLYSLGCLLYEVFLGSPPFVADTAEAVIRGHLQRAPPRLSDVPARFRAVVERLLDKDPARRPGSAPEVLESLGIQPDGAEAVLPAFSTILVGRDALLRDLEDRASRRAGGARRAVLLLGPTGIGKTRLLRELAVRLQLGGHTVHAEVCRDGKEPPGGLARRLLTRMELALGEDAPNRASLEAARASLGGERERGDRALAAGASEARAREDIVHSVVAAIAEAARAVPAAILVDDLQWADTLSLDALLQLARRMRTRNDESVFVALASRTDDETDRGIARRFETRPRGHFERLDIPALRDDGVREYLAEVLGGADAFPETYPAELRSRTGGNPFFLEEFLKLQLERGAVRRRASGWSVEEAGPPAVPESVGELTRGRLASITGARRDVLDWAAVIAEPFEPAEIGHLMGRASGEPFSRGPRDRVARFLDRSVLDGFLERRGDRYALGHAAVQNALYESIEDAERKRRHRTIAEWLLEAGDPERAGRLEQVARHLYLSDSPRLAAPYLEAAAKRALASGALAEAARSLTWCLEVVDHPRARFDALVLREEVWGRLGRPGDQRADLDRLGELARELGDAELERDAITREALYLDSQGKKREALEKIEQALGVGPDDRDARAHLLCRKGMLQLFLSERENAMGSLSEALSIARDAGNRAQEAECHQLIGLGHYLAGRYDGALPEMETALSMQTELGDAQRAGALASNLGLIQLDRGLLEAAEERFQSSLKTFRRIGHRRGEAVNLLNLGLVYSEMGLLERALGYMTEALEIRRELGDRHGEGADLGNLGEVWLRVGRFERAVPLLEEALAVAKEFENHASASVNECRLGLVDLQRGNRREARERLEHARDIARRMAGSSQQIKTEAALARLYLEEDPARALELLDGAMKLARSAQLKSRAIELETLRALAVLRLGRLEEADAASRRAVEMLEAVPGQLERSQEVWFARHRVLEAMREEGRVEPAGDPDGASPAGKALRRAYTLLREKADRFDDGELQSAFLENIPLHREINRLHEELQRRVRREASRRERSFHDIARSIHSILELDPLLDRLLELAIETTHAEKGLILLADAGGNLTIRAARGMARESVEDAADICQSVISDVARGGKPVLATDATSDDRFRERRSVISFHIRTLMCVPLRVRDETLGAVYVDGRGTSNFSGEDLEYLVSFAQLAGAAVENARLLSRLREENRDLRREVEARFRFENLVAQSEPMRRLTELMEKVARTDASVLITGETGTGKAVIARSLHYASPRRSRPFVTVDCGALPESLLESELFGHKRGAFSGAISDRVGLIEAAEGGTLFLDEITNTSADLQAKLLRVLQEGEIRRVGENTVRAVDVRIIAATNVDIQKAVEEHRFREDLYYRLNVVLVEVPPLRERRDDIPPLVYHFLEESCARAKKSIRGLTSDALRLLEAAPWRGNVRELENLVERAVVLAESDTIDGRFIRTLIPAESRTEERRAQAPEALGAAPPAPVSSPPEDAAGGGWTLEEFDRHWRDEERRYLERLVAETHWNISAAARRAGVRNRNTLVSRLKKHGIERPPAGEGEPIEDR